MLVFRKICLVFLLCLGVVASSHAQKKEMNATRINGTAKIDGVLNDDIWQSQDPAIKGQFVEFQPDNGAVSPYTSEVHVVYNDASLYIGAKLYDPRPDSIQRELGPRDDMNRNTDAFGVALDTYLKGQNSFMFVVTAAGVQVDWFESNSGGNGSDFSWDAVWNSAIQITDDGWTVEIEIPYSAIRFGKAPKQTWGVNFWRKVQRDGAESFWNHIDANTNGFINQFGIMNGISNIQPPPRIFLTPYVSTYLTKSGGQTAGTSFNYGMDLKYGINEAFTLDMTLIPDFGQVQSDNVVLNLSPFEVRFQENRPFFTEGTELFNRNGLFYSRRVGQSFGYIVGEMGPNEEVVAMPSEAPLLNATKISGRTQGGTGIGFFNAVTNHNFATVEDTETGERRQVEADPVTNFNVLVLDQNLKNNSKFGIINTNVYRFAGAPMANVTSGDFVLNDKTNTWQVSGMGAYNQRIHSDDTPTETGYKYFMSVGRVSGKLQFRAFRNVESDTYDPNDMGFLRNANEVSHGGNVSYNIQNPFWILNRWSGRVGVNHSQLHTPRRFTQFGMWSNMNMQFKNFWSMGMNYSWRPTMSHDFFEARVDGYYFSRARNHDFNTWVASDGRKAFAFEMFGGSWARPLWGQRDFWFGAFPRYRVNNRLSFTMGFEYTDINGEYGFANHVYDDNDELEEVILGRRDVNNLVSIFNTRYSFSPKMTLSLRVRHYWSQVDVFDYNALGMEGELLETEYTGQDELGNELHDFNFNAVNLDMVYQWQVAPGSFVNVVWKGSVLNSDDRVDLNYLGNIRGLRDVPGNNSISARFIYFLDYNSVKSAFRRRGV